MTSSLPVVLLHFFGSSRREWGLVAPRLEAHRRVFMLDLPGFGDAASDEPIDVAGMADRVDRFIGCAGLTDCIVVGHSMSAKVAAVLAARRPSYLRGLVLMTASPPSPEPMTDTARRELLAFDGSRGAAEKYIDGITAERLPDPERETAVSDAMRTSLAAWKHWVIGGSRADCTSTVRLLSLPTLLVAGELDESLGPRIQHARVLPHFTNATMRVIAGGHVLPLENADASYREIEAFSTDLDSRQPCTNEARDPPGGDRHEP